MTNESDNDSNIKDKQLKSSYDELCDLISQTSDKEFLMDFFNCLLTSAERRHISERWLLVKEINNKIPQREIAKKYNMSLCKITRGSRELKRKDSAFLKMLKLSEEL